MSAETRTKTRQSIDVEVDEEEITEYQCQWCDDWREEDEITTIGIDTGASDGEPGDTAQWCVYCVESVFGYAPDDETPVYQPITDEVEHWTWKEIASAVFSPLAGLTWLALVAGGAYGLVTGAGDVATQTGQNINQAMLAVTETMMVVLTEMPIIVGTLLMLWMLWAMDDHV